MKDKNEIDDLFKGKLENREFEFKDSYWNAAEELMDAHEDKDTEATPFIFNWKIIPLGIMILLVPIFLYVSFSDSSKIASIEKSAPETLHGLEETDAMLIESKAEVEMTEKSISSKQNQEDLPQSTIITQEKRKDDKPETIFQETGKEAISTGVNLKSNVPQKNQTNPASIDSEKIHADLASASLTQPQTKQVKKADLAMAGFALEKAPKSTDNQSIHTESEENTPQPEGEIVLIDLSGGEEEEQETETHFAPMDLDQMTTASLQKNTEEDFSEKASQKTQQASLNNLERIMFPSRKHTDAAVSVLFGDSQLVLSPEMQQEMDERLEKIDKPSSFGLTTGMTFSPEFSTPNPSNGITSYPLFGATYGYRVHPKLRFYTGVGYEGRGGLVGDYSYTIKDYGFGSTQTNILVSPKSLHYVKVPLFASVQVYNRHYITAGASAAYLINVSSSAETQLSGVDDSKEKVWGYKQGFSNHDIQLQIGYRYYIGKGFTVNAEASFGVNDLTDNAFFQNEQKDTNTQFRLRLAYDLFNF